MNLELSSSLHREKKLIRSFGRIKSRKFSDHKNFLLENLMPKYELDSFKSCHHKVEAGQFKEVILEIGSGFGDFIFNKDGKIIKKDIIASIEKALYQPTIEGIDIYGEGNAAIKIIEILVKIIN